MELTRERFNQGMSYDQVKESMPRNKPNMERIDGLVKLSDADLAPWRSLSENFNVMVLVIDPCREASYAFPPSFNHLRIFAIRVLVIGQLYVLCRLSPIAIRGASLTLVEVTASTTVDNVFGSVRRSV